MTNHATGHLAEEYASKYLKSLGFKIVATNWRTRYCEIDLIAERKKRLYFVEVKYRRTNIQGTGLEHITENKLRQMKFAAEVWVSENKWTKDYCLSAIEMTGDDYQVVEFLPVLD